MFNPDSLLTNLTGKKLFYDVASGLPVIDFHNHIDPKPLATNQRADNIYQLWVQHDPYKHRAMRICGIPEALISGNQATDYEKFLAWAECLTHTAGNPLFHWSCMELQQVFGFDQPLTARNALLIWDTSQELLATDKFRAMDILKSFNVELLCTSDDLLDKLEQHQAIGHIKTQVSCLPSLRGDSIVSFQPEWINQLAVMTGIEVTSLESYKKAIIGRLDFFDHAGCLLADHSLDAGFNYVSTGESKANSLFSDLTQQGELVAEDLVKLQSHVLLFLGKQYAGRQWKMQLHIGANRFTSTRLRNRLGAAGGYASIGNTVNVQAVSRFLDELDIVELLPKTILYTLNPADNAVFASLTGSFSQDHVRGKIQFGPAWWYNDHLEGITQQLITLSSYGLLSTSIGFTTDSRSILSLIRHDYYRRILCNLIGAWSEEGKLPDDREFLAQLVADISYHNIKNWIKK